MADFVRRRNSLVSRYYKRSGQTDRWLRREAASLPSIDAKLVKRADFDVLKGYSDGLVVSSWRVRKLSSRYRKDV